jgi:ATP-dependent DNA ligase
MDARLDSDDVCLLTRTGLDRTAKYLIIADGIAQLTATNAYLDGELCASVPMAERPST